MTSYWFKHVTSNNARVPVLYLLASGRHSAAAPASRAASETALAVRLLNDLGRRISSISGDTRETSHLYQRVSVLVQRFNSVLLYMTACRSLTARTEHHTLSAYFRQFLNLPRE